jgi:ribonuclease-3
VLELAVASHLYARFPSLSEGGLSRIRSHVVSRRSCANVARALKLDVLFAERFHLSDDLRRSDNVLAALIEAAIAALFLEHGFDVVATAVAGAFNGPIRYAEKVPADPKTQLQEHLGKLGQKLAYVVIEAEGPPHDRSFTCAALVDGVEWGRGTGRTKKEAEQEAALQALEALSAAEKPSPE